MYYPSIFALLAAALPLVFAAPYPTNGTNTTDVITATNTSYTITTLSGAPAQEYYLITQVLGPGNEDKDGLYVSGYHTGREFLPPCTPDNMTLG